MLVQTERVITQRDGFPHEPDPQGRVIDNPYLNDILNSSRGTYNQSVLKLVSETAVAIGLTAMSWAPSDRILKWLDDVTM